MQYQDLISHLGNECSAVKLVCGYEECQALVAPEAVEQHFKEECKNQHNIECTYCNSKMSYTQLKKHKCPFLLDLLYGTYKE